ncbi:hypothetical protein N7493_011876 [Penicillium malachiteum]|uniref:Uncharacterized protein n=1 Tax=Penicillium malachiteum TaxID=1324776 RepID=A0AAD6HAL1_9EURO|nr:hypothetical protein N7493_011876 [Penicillium malachiteum]
MKILDRDLRDGIIGSDKSPFQVSLSSTASTLCRTFSPTVSYPAQIRLDPTLDTVTSIPWFQERHGHSPIPAQQSHSGNQQLTLDLIAAEFKNDPRNPNAKSGKADH